MLHIRDISKRYGPKVILDRLSMEIPDREITTLLGPSGCGKTTLLRLIAGLDTPFTGSIAFNDTEWVSAERGIFVAPQKRNIGLVFQSYAIWPHMKVFDQIAYPLRNRRMPAAEIKARVAELLRILGLEGLEERPATMLSGGQQQRVAMARALAPNPSLLLLDEPFSNLDVSLRGQLRIELREIQRRLGVTVVLVTHDQLDAFTLSDHVAVMRDGRIEQLGTCQQVYEHPANEFVRGFVGKSVRIAGTVIEQGSAGIVLGTRDGARLHVPTEIGHVEQGDEQVSVWLRPEDLHIARAQRGPYGLPGTVRDAIYLGERYECVVDLASGQTIAIHVPRTVHPKPGEAVVVTAEDGAGGGERNGAVVSIESGRSAKGKHLP